MKENTQIDNIKYHVEYIHDLRKMNAIEHKTRILLSITLALISLSFGIICLAIPTPIMAFLLFGFVASLIFSIYLSNGIRNDCNKFRLDLLEIVLSKSVKGDV